MTVAILPPGASRKQTLILRLMAYAIPKTDC